MLMRASAEFEILGHQIPEHAPVWSEYLRGQRHCETGDLALFPWLDGMRLTDADVIRVQQANRFRWISKYIRVHPNELYGSWLDEDILLKEREFLRGCSNQDFQGQSRTFGLYMLRREMKHAEFYMQAHHFLAARIWHNDNVLVIGPTAGGEVEMVQDVGGFPLVCLGDGDHAEMCEERLLHDRVVFQAVTIDELQQHPPKVHFVVITPYVLNQRAVARVVYNLLGMHGWVVCSIECQDLIEEFERMDLARREAKKPHMAAYFKYAGLPEVFGA